MKILTQHFQYLITLTFLFGLMLLGINRLSAQQKLSKSVYIEDSTYLNIKKIIDEDNTPDDARLASIAINRIAKMQEKYLKEDTTFHYMVLGFEKFPHEFYYFYFESSEELTEHISKNYPRKDYKYMCRKRDSLIKTYNLPIRDFIFKLFAANQRDQFNYEELLKKKNLPENKIEAMAEQLKNKQRQRCGQIDSLIVIYGYPGKTLLGSKYDYYLCSLLQNSLLENFNKYFPLILHAMQSGELNKAYFANWIDKFLVDTGRKQIFGTQFFTQDNSKLGYPIGDPDDIDLRRSNFGLFRLSDRMKNNIINNE